MIEILIAIESICVVVLIVCFWLLWHNKQTLKERLAILKKVSAIAKTSKPCHWHDPYDEFDRIDYNAHLFRRATFRDPFSLYPSELRPTALTGGE